MMVTVHRFDFHCCYNFLHLHLYYLYQCYAESRCDE